MNNLILHAPTEPEVWLRTYIESYAHCGHEESCKRADKAAKAFNERYPACKYEEAPTFAVPTGGSSA